jgi:hypothetical protein
VPITSYPSKELARAAGNWEETLFATTLAREEVAAGWPPAPDEMSAISSKRVGRAALRAT